MKTLLVTAALAASVAAQLPQSERLPVGRRDWVLPCGPFLPVAFMTSDAASRAVDPGYPGTVPTYACLLGGHFHLRAVQHEQCPSYLQTTQAAPIPFFVFGPRTGNFASLASVPYFQFGQSTWHNSGPGYGLFGASTADQWEADPNVRAWSYRLDIPNTPSLSGTEWSVQSVHITLQTQTFNMGASHYIRLL